MSKNNLNKEIGERLRGARTRLGLTQAMFGEKLNLKQQQIGKIESGSQELSLPTVILLNRVFNISITHLLTGKEESGKNTGKIEEENDYLKHQLDKALALSKEADKYKRDLLDIYALLSKAGLSIKELASIAASKQAV